MFNKETKETFDEREQRILALWKKENTFLTSISQREKSPHFTFYDGPPFATGLPHYGHLLAGTIKDVVPRYKTMKGFFVPRRFGWDCHGLPVENEIEKTHNLSGAKSIEAFGIANFNEACRSIVLRYAEEWQTIVERMGRWVDFDHTYHTMDLTYMESVWWVFKELYERGLVYEGYKVMPFSAKLGTPLSNFEASENYKEVDDPSITVILPLLDDPETSLLAWTTTPWTLISNLAVMVGPEIEYVKIKDEKSGRQYVLAKDRLPHFYREGTGYTILKSFSGKELAGKRYRPLFDTYASHDAFRVILEESVSVDEGTGLVHSAPAFGEVDFYACQREGIELVCPVDTNGRFTDEIPRFAGQFVKDTEKAIIRELKEAGKIFHQGVCRHRYPFCWRSDTPLIYRVVNTWFVAVEKIKKDILAANDDIHWTPPHIKYGRFGKWLEGARDWAISRNRYWGTPIPLWRSDDGDILVIGSIQELEKLSGRNIKDLHRHFVDDITFTLNGKTYSRIPEVFDCWFESGSMPYAQNHYPFENGDFFTKNFPADFIAEGLDQTRGWFYTLTILSAALLQKPAMKNVIVNGIILAADGAKMSKRLRNYPDPMEVVKKYGADAIRLYMMHSPAVRADDLCFQEKGVELVLRQILIPFWNSYSFFLTYAKIYDWKPAKELAKPVALIDRWILTTLNKLIHDVEVGMDDYDLSRAVEPFVGFIDSLTNWYIRRSRRRFWCDEATPDRDQAFATLYQVLIALCKVAAPFVPFISDAIYRNLRRDDDPQSVHLCDYPAYREEERNQALEMGMEAVKTIVSLGHALRKEHKFKVRQPLPLAEIACTDKQERQFMEDHQHLITEELNVKKVVISGDDKDFVTLNAKPNFRVLGKKIGGKMKAAHAAIAAFSLEQIEAIQSGNSVTLPLEGETVTLTPDDVSVERVVREGLIAANVQEMTILLDTNLTEELLEEGLAREIVNKVNTMRREAGFEVTDRIALQLETTLRVEKMFKAYGDYIKEEILAVKIEFAPCEGQTWDLNGEPTKIAIQKEAVPTI